MIKDLPSPKLLISRVTWQRLSQAHNLVCQCQVSEGIGLYKTLLNNDLARFFRERLWGYSDDPTVPSLNWGCVYLAEYYFKERVWSDWLALYRMIEDDLALFPDRCRSRLIQIQGRARMHLPGHHVQQLLDEQQHAIDTLQLTEEDIAHHCLLIGLLHRRVSRPIESIAALQRAVDYFSPETHPFYGIYALDALASTYSWFQSYDASYSAVGQGMYQNIEALLATFGEGTETELQYYNQGWHHWEKQDFAEALTYFELGQQNMIKHGLVYEENLNRYGKACSYLKLQRCEDALYEAQKALTVFWSNGNEVLPTIVSTEPVSTLFTAICLYVIATALIDLGRLDEALDQAQNAMIWHDLVDHPVQLNHLRRLLARIYRQRGDDQHAAYWEALTSPTA